MNFNALRNILLIAVIKVLVGGIFSGENNWFPPKFPQVFGYF